MKVVSHEGTSRSDPAPASVCRSVRSLRLGGLLLLAALFVSGCDLLTAQEETVILRDLESRFTVSFSGSSVSAGTPKSFDSDGTVRVDLAGYVQEEGFAPGDVRSVRPESARLFVNFPPGQQLGFLDRVVVRLSASDLGAVTVASQDQFPSSQSRTSLSVNSSQSLQQHLARAMTGQLEVTTSEALDADETYELEVEMTYAVEVGGF